MRKKILITGISRGIGKAICKELVNNGYFVIGTYNTNRQEAEKIKKELEFVEVYQVDFSNRENTLKFIEKIKGEIFYALVNNAGIFVGEQFDKFSMENWDKTMEVNLNTPLILSQGLKDSLEEGGAIVNISSTDGMIGSIVGIAYSASKAALINLTQSLANVLAYKKIRVNAIAPGWIGDGMQAPAELMKAVTWLNPLGRTATYEEIANVVSYLISDKANYINGTTIAVDGGDSAVSYAGKKESELV